ncbi:hypothetical protein SIM12_18510, partial [Xanthomonas campestris pv. incanae]|nr:hypothetical protein [Xanthomonas campestris pv. incanae]
GRFVESLPVSRRVATLIGRAVICRHPKNARIALRATMHTDTPDWSLPARRRGTLRGMDAA